MCCQVCVFPAELGNFAIRRVLLCRPGNPVRRREAALVGFCLSIWEFIFENRRVLKHQTLVISLTPPIILTDSWALGCFTDMTRLTLSIALLTDTSVLDLHINLLNLKSNIQHYSHIVQLAGHYEILIWVLLILLCEKTECGVIQETHHSHCVY